MKHMRAVLLAGLVIVAGGCGGGEAEEDAAAADSTAADSSAGMAGMPGMEGMAGMSIDPAMVEQMRSHMQRMEGVSGDSLLAMRDRHRQIAANMLAQMNREMRDMGMTEDAAWTATVDSVRQDLTRMPELSASEMQTLMPEHHRRMERLIASHERMMAQMGH